jgi:sarcosine oxidase
MEAATGQHLLTVTGGVFIGAAAGPFVAKSKESADIHGVPYEILSPDEIRRRFPAFRPDEGTVGFFEPGAGILGPEACVQACLDYARAGGVDLKFDEPLLRWEASGESVTVTTAHGRYHAAKLLLATGPWMLDTLRSVGVSVTAERIVMHWFAPLPAADARAFDAGRCPLALWEFGPNAAFASFPIEAGEIKTTIHHGG